MMPLTNKLSCENLFLLATSHKSEAITLAFFIQQLRLKLIAFKLRTKWPSQINLEHMT